jgi:hypothetical protein
MKVNYFKSHYNKAHRGQLFPLLKAFIKKESFSDEERQAMYQISDKEVEFVEEISDSDICILTMSWNYYYNQNCIDDAKKYIKNANAEGKKVWTWMSGDFGVDLRFKGNYVVFRNSGHKSRLSDQHVGMPVFISDPLKMIYNTTELLMPVYNSKPAVGFCGQANSSFKQSLKEIAIRLKNYIDHKLKRTYDSPQPIQSTSLLRAKLLKILEASEFIKSNFIKRQKYRAGITENKAKHETTQEFYDNIIESHYVLCARGGGNFSVRFYETLAMGRIPIFINTDCLLPLDNRIDWKNNCVWVKNNDKEKIADKVVEFHQQHTKESLYQLMKENRELWESRMRIGSFFKYIYDTKINL